MTLFRDRERQARIDRQAQEEAKIKAEEARRRAEAEAIERERQLVRDAIASPWRNSPPRT